MSLGTCFIGSCSTIGTSSHYNITITAIISICIRHTTPTLKSGTYCDGLIVIHIWLPTEEMHEPWVLFLYLRTFCQFQINHGVCTKVHGV